MRKLLLTISALLLFAGLKAQSYQKLLPGPVTSFMVVDLGYLAKPLPGQYQIPGCTSTPASADSGYWQIYGDTVFKANTYKHVFGNGLLAGIMREDTIAKKVFFHTYCDTTAEILLYDFSLQVGDTISYYFPFSTGGNMNGGVFTVDSIQYLYNYGAYFSNHFFLSNHASPGKVLEVAEGVGSLNHPLFVYYWFSPGVLNPWVQPLSHPSIYFSKLVSCKWNDGVKVYADTVAYYLADSGHQKTVTITIHDTCDYTSICCAVGMSTTNASQTWSVYPVPSNGSILCGVEAPKETEVRFSVLNSMGRELKKFPLQKLAKGKNEISFDLNDLPNGIYLLQVHSATGYAGSKAISIQR